MMKEKDRPEFTWKNWWYYNKWFVILGVALVISAASVIAGNLTKVKPDYQIAYVGEYPLSNEAVSLVEEALAAEGRDLNGDGRVVFKLNQSHGEKRRPRDSAWAGRLGDAAYGGSSRLRELLLPA